MENPLPATQFKFCQSCGTRFNRPSRIANKQWEGRKYCSLQCQPKPVPQFIPCRICGQPTKYRGNEQSSLAGKVRCQSDDCKEASRLQKNEAIGAKAKQMYADGERGLSEETRKQISQKLSRRKLGSYSAEHCAAISRAKKGKAPSPAMLRAILASAASRKGKRCDNGLRGYKQSADHIENRRQTRIGKRLSLETRQKLSQSRKGIVFSQAHRQKLAASRKRLWAEGKLTAFRSKLEKRLGEIVEPLGFAPQFRIYGYSHPYDYGHAEKRIVIEVHGCFWHSHGCGVKQCKDNSKERDRLHEATARELGFKVFIFWQCQESDWPNQLREYGILSEAIYDNHSRCNASRTCCRGVHPLRHGC